MENGEGKSRQRCKMVRGRDSHNKIIFIARERVARERERESLSLLSLAVIASRGATK